MSETNFPELAKADTKVAKQVALLASMSRDDPQRPAELKALEMLLQSASLARMASLFLEPAD